jgi:hypothetical protein
LVIFINNFKLVVAAYSATIFDNLPSGKGIKGKSSAHPKRLPNQLDNDHTKRHIKTFRVLNSKEKHSLERRMEDKTQSFNDDTSNGTKIDF